MTTLRSVLCITMVAGCASASTIFEDDFANGVVADSKSISGFWTTTGLGSGDANAVSESGGTLTITAGSNDGGDDGAYSASSLYSAVTNDINFFSRPTVFKLRGISFDDSGAVPAVPDNAQRFRFWVGSSGSSPYGADDAIVVRFTPEGKIRLGSKEDEPNTNTDGDLIYEFTGLGVDGTYGCDLTLAYANSNTVHYRLEAYTGASPVSQGVQIGTISMNASAWGSGARASKIGVQAQEGNVTGGNQYFSAMVTNLLVTDTGNLLTNPGFEDGTNYWKVLTASLTEDSGTVRSGSKSGVVTNRTATWSSVRRDLDSLIFTGATYRISIWARLASGGPDSANLTVKVNDQGGARDRWFVLDTEDLVSTDWTYLEGDYTLEYDAPLGYVFFYVPNVEIGTNLFVDDAAMYLLSSIGWSGETMTNVIDTSAWASADVDAVLAEDTVLVWGETDYGTGSTNDWPNSVSLGPQGPGIVTGQLTGLTGSTEYTWRLYGENAATNAWSAATVFTSSFTRVSVGPSSKDYIIGEREAGAAALGYYVNGSANVVGVSGASGSRDDRNIVFGYSLPTLSGGTTITGAIFRFEITHSRDTDNSDPSLQVYLLNTSNPDSSGTGFFYHGASNTTANAKFIGSNYLAIGSTETNYPDDEQDIEFAITGDALTLLSSWYGGDNVPEQSEVFFRFNLDPDPPVAGCYTRYRIDTANSESSLVIEQTPPPPPGTLFLFE